MNTTKIFISYAHEDIDIAKRIYNDLKRYGLDVWIDCENLLIGKDWDFEIENVIRNSKYFLALLSSTSVNKVGYVQKELRNAIEKLDLYPEGGIYILPVRIDDCKPIHRKIKRIHWINLFPENNYKNGIAKLSKVVIPQGLVLRSKQIALSQGDAAEMIRKYDFYDEQKNPEGKGIHNKYEVKEINNIKIVCDRTTGLMWQQSGLDELEEFYGEIELNYNEACEWIEILNNKNYAGYNDWRLPTLEEAMSLMERNDDGSLYSKRSCINSLFDTNLHWIWTIDFDKYESDKIENRAWWVYYGNKGSCESSSIEVHHFVRAVRSG